MVIQTLVLSATLICALQAIRAPRLLVSALWLAGCSALLALSLALLGAPEVGVVELSVGAGLVTVIFVFAISVAGEESIGLTSIVPRPLAWVLMGLFLFLLAWLTLPGLVAPALPRDALPFLRALWDERSLDTVLQVALIFSGVLGSLGLLAERREVGERHGRPAEKEHRHERRRLDSRHGGRARPRGHRDLRAADRAQPHQDRRRPADLREGNHPRHGGRRRHCRESPPSGRASRSP